MNEIIEQVNGLITIPPELVTPVNGSDVMPPLPIPLFSFNDEVHEAYEAKAFNSSDYEPVYISVNEPFEEQAKQYYTQKIIVDRNIAVQFKAEAFLKLMHENGCEIHIAPDSLFNTLGNYEHLEEAIVANPCKVYLPSTKEPSNNSTITKYETSAALKDVLMPRHKAEWGVIKPQEWVVPNMMHKKGITMWYGDTQAGKTTLLVDLLMHLGGEKVWFDKELQKTKVLIITCEGGADVQEKVWAFERAKFPVEDKYISKIDYQVSFAKDDLHVDTIISNIQDLKIDFGVIVIDTLSQVALGLNFNSPEMGVVLARAHKLMNAFNCNIVLVAHVGKDATRGMTGWHGWSTNTDSIMYIEMHTEEHRSLTVEKVKGRKSGETLHFMFEEESWMAETGLIEAPIVKVIDDPSTTKLTRRYQVLQVIVENPNKTQLEMLKVFKDQGNKIDASALSKACAWLKMNEMIMQTENRFKATFTGENELSKKKFPQK